MLIIFYKNAYTHWPKFKTTILLLFLTFACVFEKLNYTIYVRTVELLIILGNIKFWLLWTILKLSFSWWKLIIYTLDKLKYCKMCVNVQAWDKKAYWKLRLRSPSWTLTDFPVWDFCQFLLCYSRYFVENISIKISRYALFPLPKLSLTVLEMYLSIFKLNTNL